MEVESPVGICALLLCRTCNVQPELMLIELLMLTAPPPLNLPLKVETLNTPVAVKIFQLFTNGI
jgi:hypothetical protein